MTNTVLAIDPGRMKCGVAVVRRCAPGDGSPVQPSRLCETLYLAVVQTESLPQLVGELAGKHAPDVIVIGNGTTSSEAVTAVEGLGVGPVERVDEKFSTLLARKRYFEENPPKGLRRLIPTSLQTPPRPCDDYVAVILAERYLS